LTKVKSPVWTRVVQPRDARLIHQRLLS
jgi:hypothetical protein